MPIVYPQDVHYRISQKRTKLVFVLDNSEKKSLDNFTLERTGGENIIPRKSFKISELNAIQAGYNYSTINMLEVLNMIELSLEKIVYIQLMARSDFNDDLDIFDQILAYSSNID